MVGPGVEENLDPPALLRPQPSTIGSRSRNHGTLAYPSVGEMSRLFFSAPLVRNPSMGQQIEELYCPLASCLSRYPDPSKGFVLPILGRNGHVTLRRARLGQGDPECKASPVRRAIPMTHGPCLQPCPVYSMTLNQMLSIK